MLFMATTTLQIPIDKSVRDNATRVAHQRGFSSVQEVVRVFLSQFADRCVDVSFTPPTIQLSEKNDKRYAKMIEDYENGKLQVKSFTDVDELMKELNS